MTIPLTCSCGKRLRVEKKNANKRLKCPHCNQAIVFPSADSARPTSPDVTPALPRAVALSEDEAHNKDRQVEEILQRIDDNLERLLKRDQWLKRIAKFLAGGVTLLCLLIWTTVFIAMQEEQSKDKANEAMLGMGSCLLLLVVPFASYIPIKAALLRRKGRRRDASDPAVYAQLVLLEQKFPEYVRALGGCEKALAVEGRRHQEEFYFFRLPGAKTKRATVQMWIEKLTHGAQHEAVEAVTSLAESGDPHAIEPLFAAARQHEFFDVRKLAARSLAQMRDPRAERRFLNLISERDSYALKVAAELPNPAAATVLVELLQYRHAWVRNYAALGLAQLNDDRGMHVLLQELESCLPSAFNKHDNEFIAALKQLSMDALLREIDRLLKSSDANARCRAANILERRGDAAAIEKLVPLLADGNLHVRWHAILAIVGLARDPKYDAIRHHALCRLPHGTDLTCFHEWGEWISDETYGDRRFCSQCKRSEWRNA